MALGSLFASRRKHDRVAPGTSELLSVSSTEPRNNGLGHLFTASRFIFTGTLLVTAGLLIVGAAALYRQNISRHSSTTGNTNLNTGLAGGSAATKTDADGYNTPDSPAGGTSLTATASDGTTQVNVDGQSVNVPAGNTYSRTVTDGNTTTTVNVSTSGTSTNSSHVSTQLMVSGNSSSSGSDSTMHYYSSTSP